MQAFLTSLFDVDSVDLTTLDTLQHRLSGKRPTGASFGRWWGSHPELFSYAGAQLVCEANPTPASPWRKLHKT